jgi:hypothetical protein
MKRLLLSLLSITVLVSSANAMGPLGSAMINHDRQGDRRTVVIPSGGVTDKSVSLGALRSTAGLAFLGPLHPTGSFVFLGPLHPTGSFAFLGPLHPTGSFAFIGPLHPRGSFAFIGPLHSAKV